MKRLIALSLALCTLLAMLVFSGCGSTEPSLIKRTVSVLYVENEGFIVELPTGYCYVQYVNANQLYAVGDTLEIEYYEHDHLVATPDEGRGGYLWNSYIRQLQALR